jgi:hypothetical protein
MNDVKSSVCSVSSSSLEFSPATTAAHKGGAREFAKGLGRGCVKGLLIVLAVLTFRAVEVAVLNSIRASLEVPAPVPTPPPLPDLSFELVPLGD